MAKYSVRGLTPLAGTGSFQTIYTCPTGKRAKLRQITFCNTSGSPAATGLYAGTGASGTAVVLAGTLLAGSDTKTYNIEIPLTASQIVQVSCGASVTTTASIVEEDVTT